VPNVNLLPLLCFFTGLLAGFMGEMFRIEGGCSSIFIVSWALTHRKNIDIKTGAYIIVGGSLGLLAGALLVGIISRVILAILFLLSSGATVLGMYFYKLAPRI